VRFATLCTKDVAAPHNFSLTSGQRAPTRRQGSNQVTQKIKPREVFIQGITQDGRTFRPSDWAERLAGAMSCFRPGGGKTGPGGIGSAIGYSPYCIPTVIGSTKCVVVNEALKGIEPMAWDFVMNFARDNNLQVMEACLLPDPPAAKKG
jgi:hypothetical protein